MKKLALYGLKNCDTCKKARNELEAAGLAVVFIDIRAEADLGVKVPLWIASVGAEKLVNKRSTTWRGLSEADQSAALSGGAETVLIANPTLIKRPVIEFGDSVYAGWTGDVKSALIS